MQTPIALHVHGLESGNIGSPSPIASHPDAGRGTWSFRVSVGEVSHRRERPLSKRCASLGAIGLQLLPTE